MYMFVPVKVRWRDPGVADFLNLRLPFGLHFLEREPAPRATQKQALGSARELAAVIQQTGNAFPVGHRRAIAQVQMHAHP